MAEDNKNSFRDMLIIIFVVLVCFGITIYGIAYLTGKVFSSSPEPEIASNNRPKDITTNPKEGDTLIFTSIDTPADEVKPSSDNILTTITPPQKNNIEVANNNIKKEEKTEPSKQDNKEIDTNKKNIDSKQENSKVVADNTKNAPKPEQKQTESKQAEPKPVEPKKETVKTVPPAQTGAFVVQILAAQSREAALKEASKYQSKYPDIFVKQVVINGKTWYRVRLGVSNSREEAERIANKISQEFKIKPLVTKNN